MTNESNFTVVGNRLTLENWQWFSATSGDFEMFTPLKPLKQFWDVPCINKKAIGVSKYIILWQRFALICHRKNSTDRASGMEQA